MTYSATRQPITISERRSQYPFHERLVIYNTESMQKMLESKKCNTNDYVSENVHESSTQTKNQKFMVNGVNILNKNSVDSDTAMHRIIQRRKTHNRVERRRRDRMNNLFLGLSNTLPSLRQTDNNSNRADILQEAIKYVKILQAENSRLKGHKSTHTFEDDDLSSLCSFGSSNSSGSSLSTADPMFISSSSFSTSEKISIPAILEDKHPMVSLRPQNQYESIIIFD